MSTFTPPAPPSYAEASPRVRAAKLVTDVLAPANLVIVLLLVVGWHSTHSVTGAGWGLLAAFFCGVLPITIVQLGVRRGRLTDKHIRIRRQRILPLGASLLSVVVGIALLHALQAPRDVSALLIAMLVGLASTLLVTVWWQVSVHNTVAGGTVMILMLVFGWPASPSAVIVLLIGWSRRVLKAHTLAQLVCGTALGAVAAAVFTFLR
ncbi:hypothetical protein PJ985_03055 [Streptomyces sp. ACA25]|uniref:hypothetical protein n=1 Tax=Streptomyces sp. ACA25 TaxID=3022596 RepID=UPI002307A93A|nr:hypothetical protein [Streptomyces sp. ACA25]MDB1086544.1 hypothetical protein [Streptomyces sp. ACA25]